MPFDGIPFNDITAVGVFITFATLVITDRLVWHTRLRSAEDRADRWEKVALDALGTGGHAGVRAAEVSNEVLSRLPSPRDPEEAPTP